MIRKGNVVVFKPDEELMEHLEKHGSFCGIPEMCIAEIGACGVVEIASTDGSQFVRFGEDTLYGAWWYPNHCLERVCAL